MTKTIGILGFDNVEALDFTGPFEVFTTADRVASREGLGHPFKVVSLSTQPSFIARAGLSINAGFILGTEPKIDILIVPGGVTSEAEKNAELISWLRGTYLDAEIVASVCTGVFLLAVAGLIEEVPVTTHWEDIVALKERFPKLEVKSGTRWVDTGKLVSSAGISAGMDMSLHLVERLTGANLAVLTAKQMDYNWQK
ncbi:MAG: DJ-1/PfpI family protein [Candidatus Nanopelagicaceae bacterium]|nr:DJ-1/PfpI family protein [Candidatus Nanopelagicaceae bacterium]